MAGTAGAPAQCHLCSFVVGGLAEPDPLVRRALQPGARVPSITTLMQEYGIARNTARHALAVLAEGGLVETTPGWGSFVKPDN